MKYDLKKPCDKCPFRSDIDGYLNPDRVYEFEGVEFACHKTTVSDEDSEDSEMITTPESQHCAGSLIIHENQETPHQMMRICERLGMYDRSKLDLSSPVFESFDEMSEAQPER